MTLHDEYVSDPWERVDVSTWVKERTEASGSSTADWLRDPVRVDSRGRALNWLHKDTTISIRGDARVEQDEDWAEIVSTAVAGLLTVPRATTQLCVRNGRRGTLSLDVLTDLPPGHAFDEGRVVLEDCVAVSNYYPHLEQQPGVDPERPEMKRPGHTLANIKAALRDTDPFPSFDPPAQLTGFDMFVGFTILDALIANGDRHEQNWAVLSSQLRSSRDLVAPSYDHAGSVGYNLTDEQRIRYGRSEALPKWAQRGTARRFEHVKGQRPPSLIDHAAAAIRLCTEPGANYWREVINTMNLEPVVDELSGQRIPELSVPAANFASALLTHNLERLRNAI